MQKCHQQSFGLRGLMLAPARVQAARRLTAAGRSPFTGCPAWPGHRGLDDLPFAQRAGRCRGCGRCARRRGGRPASEPPPPPAPDPRTHAFSLIELAGVMAIIAILATAMVPVVLKQMDQAAWTKETSDLGVMAAAFQSYILSSKSVPSNTNWAAAVSSVAAMPLPSITTTPRGYARAFLLDTNGWLGTVSLPFNQTASGTPRPVNARVMIVATLSRSLPVASGAPPAASFNDLWNTPPRGKPPTWTNWAGNGQDLVIQRINLEPLFHRLILNQDDSGTVGSYVIDNNPAVHLPAGTNVLDAYFLDGTVLRLGDTNANPNLITQKILKGDYSPLFPSTNWPTSLQFAGATNNNAGPYAALAAQITPLANQFLNAPTSPHHLGRHARQRRHHVILLHVRLRRLREPDALFRIARQLLRHLLSAAPPPGVHLD